VEWNYSEIRDDLWKGMSFFDVFGVLSTILENRVVRGE
jgi:hypothetical protein